MNPADQNLEAKLAFNYLDLLINGDEEVLNDKVRYWRTRYLLIPSGKDPPSLASIMPKNDTFDRGEILMEGAERVLDVFNKLVLKRSLLPQSTKDWRTLKLIPTSYDPSACVLDDGLMGERERTFKNEEIFERGKKLEGLTLKEVAEMMCKERNGLVIYDRWYHCEYTYNPTDQSAYTKTLSRESNSVSGSCAPLKTSEPPTKRRIGRAPYSTRALSSTSLASTDFTALAIYSTACVQPTTRMQRSAVKRGFPKQPLPETWSSVMPNSPHHPTRKHPSRLCVNAKFA